jgi:hypothetical protein
MVSSTTIDATLVERIRRGHYEVDAHAVADAMMRRGSAVLVAAQALQELPARAGERESEAGSNAA